MRALLQRVIDHLRWADEQTLAALADKGAPAIAQERFMHVIAAEHVWVARIRGEAPKVAVWPPFTLDGCRRLMAQNHREFAAVLQSEADLDRVVAYQTSDGRPFANTVADIVQHVAMHGCWHRGQIALLARQVGRAPVPTDYIAHVRGGPAAITPRP